MVYMKCGQRLSSSFHCSSIPESWDRSKRIVGWLQEICTMSSHSGNLLDLAGGRYVEWCLSVTGSCTNDSKHMWQSLECAVGLNCGVNVVVSFLQPRLLMSRSKYRMSKMTSHGPREWLRRAEGEGGEATHQ